MQVPLHGAYRPPQRFGQRAHPRPTKAAFVVGVVREGAVGRDGLGRHSACNQVLDLRDSGEPCWMVRFTKAAGPGLKESPRRFFYAVFLLVRTLPAYRTSR